MDGTAATSELSAPLIATFHVNRAKIVTVQMRDGGGGGGWG